MRIETQSVTLTPVVWHWQERFEPVDVEGACRRQILKVRRSKSYSRWLNEKTRAGKQPHTQEHDDNNQEKQAECDAAFRDFLRRKRKQERNAKKQQQTVTQEKDNGSSKTWCKPPSLHVNPKTKKSSTRKAERTSLTKANSSPFLRHEHSEAENQQAHEAWLARVRLEDRVRRAQRRDELDRLEQQQREKHKVTWRKKLAVCANTTLPVVVNN